jgi:hypothetical protein
MSQPIAFDKQKVAFAVVVLTMLTAPVAIGFKYLEPMLDQPAEQLFTRMPVRESDLSLIPVRERNIRSIPVRVLPEGRPNIPVTFKDLSTIPVSHKHQGGEGLPPVEGLHGVQTRHSRSRGIQPRMPSD